MFHPNGPSFFELARQALSSTKKGYDLLATKFDVTPFRTSNVILQSVSLELESLGSFEHAIDFCCGTGAGMQMLAPHCTGITGVDFSPGMIDVAKKNLAGVDAELQWIEADVLSYQFKEEFDLAVCFGALGHIPAKNEQLFVEQVYSSLKPGGRFVFVTSSMPPIMSREYLLSRSFNAAMRVRNLLIRPAFIMYYLTFLWPDIKDKLQRAGFEVETRPTFPGKTGAAERYVTVIARKP